MNVSWAYPWPPSLLGASNLVNHGAAYLSLSSADGLARVTQAPRRTDLIYLDLQLVDLICSPLLLNFWIHHRNIESFTYISL